MDKFLLFVAAIWTAASRFLKALQAVVVLFIAYAIMGPKWFFILAGVYLVQALLAAAKIMKDKGV